VCVFVCVNESEFIVYVCLFRADLHNNVLRVRLDCTGRKGMNSNVKRLTFIHYGWYRHHMMSKPGGLWDRVTRCKRSNRKQKSASRKKKKISLLPDGGTLKYSSVHGMVCKAFAAGFLIHRM